MPKYQITEAQIQQIYAILAEMPAKLSLPAIDILRSQLIKIEEPKPEATDK